MDLKSLDGEDVCVCAGGCADDDMPHWAGRIALSRATTVVCIYGDGDRSGRAGVERFAQTLERNLPSGDVHRRIFVMSAAEWERFFAAHRKETYSIVHFHIDAATPLPSCAADAHPSSEPAALRAFGDIAPLKERLLKIVELFAKHHIPGGGGGLFCFWTKLAPERRSRRGRSTTRSWKRARSKPRRTANFSFP